MVDRQPPARPSADTVSTDPNAPVLFGQKNRIKPNVNWPRTITIAPSVAFLTKFRRETVFTDCAVPDRRPKTQAATPIAAPIAAPVPARFTGSSLQYGSRRSAVCCCLVVFERQIPWPGQILTLSAERGSRDRQHDERHVKTRKERDDHFSARWPEHDLHHQHQGGDSTKNDD